MDDINNRETGNLAMTKLDEIDIKLLRALQKDAKANTKELCEMLNLSKTPVYERMRRLENEGVITGYSAIIDNKKVGLPLIVFAMFRWLCMTMNT